MILATNNEGKLREVKQILTDYCIYSLADKGIAVDVQEDKDTFLGNAMKKAYEIYQIAHEDTIADDSGLCIDALDGFPGVMTHRFLGEEATDEERNEYLIKEADKHDDRSAKVVCNLVLYNGEEYIIGEGILEGKIARERRGTNGFGFDDIFELPNGKTLAELSPEEKNAVSARALAAKSLKKKLELKNTK